MSDQTQTPTGAEVDPLTQAAGSIDTTIPLLQPDRTMRLQCISCKVEPTKTDDTRNVLTIICKTTTDGVFTTGKTAHAGYKLYKRISVSPSEPKDGKEGRTKKAIAQDITRLLNAFYGVEKAKPIIIQDFLANPSVLEGLPVDGRINIEKSQGNFPDKNGVSFVIPA